MNSESFKSQDDLGKMNERYTRQILHMAAIKHEKVETQHVGAGLRVITPTGVMRAVKANMDDETSGVEFLASLIAYAEGKEARDSSPTYAHETYWEVAPKHRFSDWDFRSRKTGVAFEAKYDRKAAETGNLFFEYSQRSAGIGSDAFNAWHDSGVEVTNAADWWTHSLPGGIVLVMRVQDLRACYRDAAFRESTCFNNNGSRKVEARGVLVNLPALARGLNKVAKSRLAT